MVDEAASGQVQRLSSIAADSRPPAAAASDVQRRSGGVHAAGQPPLPAAFGPEHADAHLGASPPDAPVLGLAHAAAPAQAFKAAGAGAQTGAGFAMRHTGDCESLHVVLISSAAMHRLFTGYLMESLLDLLVAFDAQ